MEYWSNGRVHGAKRIEHGAWGEGRRIEGGKVEKIEGGKVRR